MTYLQQVLCIENGAYGKRLGKVCDVMGVEYKVLSFPEDKYVDPKKVEELLKKDSSFTLVAMVHCETSSGVINPVADVGKVVKKNLPGEFASSHALEAFHDFCVSLSREMWVVKALAWYDSEKKIKICKALKCF